MSVWSGVLDSCPGLLCCVINLRGKLLYASHGYKVVASRLFGHKCNEGSSYPPLITELDRALHEVLMAACLGDTNGIEISERDKIWEFTASPLRIDTNKIEGVVIKVSSENVNPSKNLPPVVESNPEILDSVPFRACVVDSNGEILAINKFLAASCEDELTGKNITEIVKLESNANLMRIISDRVGNIECNMPDISVGKNFYDDDINIYFDEEYTQKPSEPEASLVQIIKLHASPIKWKGSDNVMLTFEDVTEFRQTHDQLQRLLTFDASTGILNRRGIEHMILQEFSSAIRNTAQLSLIMINIDNFKALNETRGYAVGTRIIRSFVNSMDKFLSSHTRYNLARWSGDEFLILVHCSGAAAVVLANSIRERANGIVISAGVADLAKGAYAGVNDFIAAAYDAMVEAKLSGKNSTVLAEN